MRLFFWCQVACIIFFSSGPLVADKLPPRFIPNKNQWQSDVQYVTKVPGGNLALFPGRFRYVFVDRGPGLHDDEHDHDRSAEVGVNNGLTRGHILDVTFPGSDPNIIPAPFGQSPEYYNFFVGDSTHWASGVHGYDGLVYNSFYAGIDLKIYYSAQGLKYDFVVSAGHDASVIAMRYGGANQLSLDNGNLRVATSVGEMVERRPFAYQIINGKKVQVKCEFQVSGSQVKFVFPDGYDRCEVLVIDPLLIFSTFSGSEADNWGSSATPGESGTLYSAGVTNHFVAFGPNDVRFSGDYPATPGAFQTTWGGNYDIGILKYDSAGTRLLYASYLGGSSLEFPHSLVVNKNHELLVLGTTSSANFPTTPGAFDTSFNGGTPQQILGGMSYPNGSDIILSRISQNGSTLLSSTFVGGNANDGVNFITAGLNKNYGDDFRGDIIADADGNVYVATITASANFPVRNSFQTTYRGGALDGVVIKLAPDLSQITWGAFIGGSAADACHTIQFDQSGHVYVAGGTFSTNLPVTTGSYQGTLKGEADGWLAGIHNDGSAISACTYTGTLGFDQIYFLDLSQDEDVFVYGVTNGLFPVTVGAVSHRNSGQFLQRFDHALTRTKFSTVFGSGKGSPDISPTAFLVNDCDNVYMAGWGGDLNDGSPVWFPTTTSGMFTTPDALQRTTQGHDFYFIVMNSSGTVFLYSTFFGGSTQTHVDGGTSRFDKSGVVYHAVCAGCRGTNAFPTTDQAWSNTNNSLNCNNAAFKFDLASLRARMETNSTAFDNPGIRNICIPDSIAFENFSIGGETYVWDFGDGQTLTTDSQDPVKHFYETRGSYLVKLKAIDEGTCQVRDSTSLVVNIHQEQIQFPDDSQICEGASYKLDAPGGMSYTWFTSDGSFETNQPAPVVTPGITTVYKAWIVDSNGCEKRDSVEIKVIPKLVPEYEYKRGDACDSDPAILLTNTTTNRLPSDIMFFDFGDGSQDDKDEVEHVYDRPGSYLLKLVGVRETCVFEKASVLPFYFVFVPNVITPGEPGLNDVWRINLASRDGSDAVDPRAFGYKTAVTIYNRWGIKVFEEKDYQSDWSANGMAAGTYYFEVNVEEHPGCRGWLHVIK